MAPNENQLTERSVGKGQDDKEEDEEKRKLVGYRGEWYDVTNFLPKHPGGKILEHFIGQDATYEIEIYHYGNVLKNRKPVKSNKKLISNQDAYSDDMIKLQQKLKDTGYFTSSGYWYVMKCLVTTSILPVVVAIVLKKGDSALFSLLAGLILAMFWQQCGLLMHDFLHNEVTQNIRTGELFGNFFCTVCFGMSMRGWKEEHNQHHVMTNVADKETNFVDPQTFQDVFAQNTKLIHFVKPKMRWNIKIQYITFLPLLLLGRLRIITRSYIGEDRKDVIAAIAFHWLWIFTLLMQFPKKSCYCPFHLVGCHQILWVQATVLVGSCIYPVDSQCWKHALLFYWAASVGEGVLHLQLLVNHYSKPYYEKVERHRHSHFHQMIKSNINIVNPIWADWFHGGLNFHIEHHSFPRLPRHRYREVSPMIKAICHRHNIEYDECSTYDSIRRTLVGLWEASQVYKLLEMN